MLVSPLLKCECLFMVFDTLQITKGFLSYNWRTDIRDGKNRTLDNFIGSQHAIRVATESKF